MAEAALVEDEVADVHADGRELARIGIRALADARLPLAEMQSFELDHHRDLARKREGNGDAAGHRAAFHRDFPRALAWPQPAAHVVEQ